MSEAIRGREVEHIRVTYEQASTGEFWMLWVALLLIGHATNRSGRMLWCETFDKTGYLVNWEPMGMLERYFGGYA